MKVKKSVLAILASGIIGLSVMAQGAHALGTQNENMSPLEHNMIMLNETGEPAEKKNLSDYQGEVVLVQFWATFCGYCKANFPKLSAISDRFEGQGLNVIAVSTDSDGGVLIDYLQSENPGVQIAWDISDTVSTAYEVSSIPHTLILDRDGNIIHEQIGAYSSTDVEVLEQKISTAIGS